MAVAAAKQRKAPQKAVKWTAADRRKMLGLKVDRKLCRRMSKMWQRREKGWSKTISRVVQDSLLNGLLLVGDGNQAAELLQIVAAPCLESPAVVVVRYTTHFTPASASPSAGHMKRTRAEHMKDMEAEKVRGKRSKTTSVAHKLRLPETSA